jgi:transposase
MATHGRDAFPGSGKMRPEDAELKRLREENRIIRIEHDIQKKRCREIF